jgi:hypothetical protein
VPAKTGDMYSTEPLPAPALSRSATKPRRDARRDAPLTATKRPTFGEMLDEDLPLIGIVFVAPPPVTLVAGPWLLLALMLSGPVALLFAFMAVLVVAAVLVATLVGVFAMPYILVRRLHQRYRTSPAAGARCPPQVVASRRMTRRVALHALAASPDAIGDDVSFGHLEVSEADTASFYAARPRLLRIAHRMLANTVDADDVVQDTWIRWQRADRTKVRDAAAFLATTTRRLAINATQSARARHETHIGPWLPEPAGTEPIPRSTRSKAKRSRSR